MRPVTREVPPAMRDALAELFRGRGHALAKNPKNRYIAFEVRTADTSIFTLYTSGKLVSSVREGDGEGLLLEDEIGRRLGSPAARPAKAPVEVVAGDAPWLGGLDETGTGELIGTALVGGALFPRELAQRVDEAVGHVATKGGRAESGWERLGDTLAGLRAEGLALTLQAIPNRLFDRYSKNGLLDLAYVRAAANLRAAAGGVAEGLALAIDDFGAGPALNQAVETWRGQGQVVTVQTKADDRFLAARAASVWARSARAREMAGLAQEVEDGPLGSGNPGHRDTKRWLRGRSRSGAPWPSFVKASFSTVRDLDGDPRVEKLPVPGLSSLLGRSARAELLAGRLDPAETALSGVEAERLALDAHGGLVGGGPAVPFLSLLLGGLVFDLDAPSLETVDLMLDRERGAASGWRVLIGPTVDQDDPLMLALLRAHRRGVIHVEPTTQDDPEERSAVHGALRVTDRAGARGLHVWAGK